MGLKNAPVFRDFRNAEDDGGLQRDVAQRLGHLLALQLEAARRHRDAQRGDGLAAHVEHRRGEAAEVVAELLGVEGDLVVCCEAGSGRLVVNGEPVDEPYAGDVRPGGDVPFRVEVPDGAVWVMGDNRPASSDSRATVSAPGHGAVSREDLRGTLRAWWRG